VFALHECSITAAPRLHNVGSVSAVCSGQMQLHTSLEGRVKLLLALAVKVANVVQRHGLALHGVVLAVPRLDRFDLYTHHAGQLFCRRLGSKGVGSG